MIFCPDIFHVVFMMNLKVIGHRNQRKRFVELNRNGGGWPKVTTLSRLLPSRGVQIFLTIELKNTSDCNNTSFSYLAQRPETRDGLARHEKSQMKCDSTIRMHLGDLLCELHRKNSNRIKIEAKVLEFDRDITP